MNKSLRELICLSWTGLPIIYLEIGVFKGKSLKWMLNNVLTHPDSRSVGVDPWKAWDKYNDKEMEEIRKKVWEELWPKKQNNFKCRLAPYTSRAFLGGDYGLSYFLELKPLNVDICYLDGDPEETLVDALLCWPLLKVGGWMIFGDDADLDVADEFAERKHRKIGKFLKRSYEKMEKDDES